MSNFGVDHGQTFSVVGFVFGRCFDVSVALFDVIVTKDNDVDVLMLGAQ